MGEIRDSGTPWVPVSMDLLPLATYVFSSFLLLLLTTSREEEEAKAKYDGCLKEKKATVVKAITLIQRRSLKERTTSLGSRVMLRH